MPYERPDKRTKEEIRTGSRNNRPMPAGMHFFSNTAWCRLECEAPTRRRVRGPMTRWCRSIKAGWTMGFEWVRRSSHTHTHFCAAAERFVLWTSRWTTHHDWPGPAGRSGNAWSAARVSRYLGIKKNPNAWADMTTGCNNVIGDVCSLKCVLRERCTPWVLGADDALSQSRVVKDAKLTSFYQVVEAHMTAKLMRVPDRR